MLRLCVLAALVALAVAAPRVNIDKPGPLLIDKGFSTVITFTLDEPILCEDPAVFCGVVVLLTNTDTKSVSINTCQIKWTRDDWFVPRQVTVKATENFVDDGQKTILIRTEVVRSNSEYYKNFNPTDITIITKSRPTKTCSATGDPHYTTFDGYYWHYYRPGQQVLYKSTVREFEIQSRLYNHPNWYPSLHCGIAAREGNDIVYVNRCPGDTPGIVVNFNSPAAQQPIVTRSGGSYTITFRSGAAVRMDDGGLYYNVYVTAPGIDWGNTVGLCGNNNGNPNDDAPGYVVDDANLLFPSQRVNAANDLWSWKPSTITTAPTLPPFAQECAYVEPVVNRPVLTNGDAEDITDILKNLGTNGTPRPLTGVVFDDTYNPGATEKPFDRAEAEATCRAALVTSPLGLACGNLPGIRLQTFIDNCMIDLELGLGDTRFVRDAVTALQDACSAIAGSDVSTWVVGPDGVLIPNPAIVNQLCPNACSNRGVCQAGTCQCNSPFKDVDCSHDPTKPASISMVTPNGCDAQDPRGCPTVIQISGSNFLAQSGATCLIGTVKTNLTYISPTLVQCDLPTNQNNPTSLFSLPVSVSNDGVNFSNEPKKFTWFDSVCHVCDRTGACAANPTSCVIEGKCFRDLVSKEGNPCLVCNATAAVNGWSYSYTDHISCSPIFEADQYIAPILDDTPANKVLVTVRATNERLINDPNFVVKYTIGSGSNPMFKVDPVSGAVSTINQIKPAEVDLYSFKSLVIVIATGPAGLIDTTNVFVQLQGTNQAPNFEKATYTFTAQENIAIGTVVGRVNATDPNAAQQQSGVNLGWATFTYGWILQEANFGDVFAVNEATGVVTVAKAIDFERKASYLLHVRAIDGGGQYGTAVVTINIENVNEAPTAVAISSDKIKEGSAPQTPVGVLSAVDPDAGDSATFSLVSTSVPFAVSAGKLVVTSVLDFETGSKSYDVIVKAVDQGGLETMTTFTINVEDVNEAPTGVTVTADVAGVSISGTSITIAEDFLVQTSFAVASATDVDAGQQVNCVVSGTTFFQITANRVVLIAPLDFETAASLTFKVACADNGTPSLSSSFVTYTVTVTDVNESGQNVRLLQQPNPLAEDSATGSVVGVVSAFDYDFDATTLSFSTDAADHFEVSGPVTCVASGSKGAKQCQVALVVRGGVDFETAGIDAVHITTVDNHGKSSVNVVSVTVSDANDAPSGVELTSNRITQGAPNGAVVGNVVIVDQDAVAFSTYTVTLTNNAGGRFSLKSSRRNSETTYQIVVADTSRINAITTPQLTVGFRVIDDGFDNFFNVVINVDPRPIVPVMSATSVPRNFPVGTKLASVSLDGLDRDDLIPTYSISGADASFFVLSGDAGRKASLTLINTLVGTGKTALSFTIKAEFAGNLVAAVQKSFTVTVNEVNQAPAFTDAYPTVFIRDDVSDQTTLVTVSASDAEGTALTYSIVSTVPSSFGSHLSIDGSSGAIVAVVTSSAIALGDYSAKIRVSDGIDTATIDVGFSVVDDCYRISVSDPEPCNGQGTCIDGVASYTCDCNAPFSGIDCADVNVDLGDKEASSSNAIGGGAIAGIVIAVIICIILVLFVLLVVMRRKQNRAKSGLDAVDSEGQTAVFNNGFIKEDTYDLPMKNAVETDFEPGVNNPLYAWYQPSMTRQECEDLLAGQGEGAFVIRDSSFTPGWHMLGVKTGNQIVHERIKLHQDGTYELLPSTGTHQPNFRVLTELVDHYAAVKREGVPFSLALDNPLYDNHLLQAAPRSYAPITTVAEADAPAVPAHEYARRPSLSLKDKALDATVEA